MSDYNVILDTQLDPDAPITSALGYQFRDNPIAIAEGAESAVKISPVAFNGVFLGYFQQSNATWEGAINLDRHKSILVQGAYDGPSGSGDYQIRFTDDNGSSWGSAQTLFTAGADAKGFIAIYFDMETGDLFYTQSKDGSNSANDVTTLTVPSDANGFQIRNQSGITSEFGFIAFSFGGVT